ncbi:hypothetical protein ET475_09410 [Microbacterium protaetiae]|uniref:Lipoprotein n=1 Tax=Microbacterium protaetiae TaxID=2509458 RepID=A0A4P6EDH6_9MICO|nr:hypothetical protein [Microbacterium protaetiae]QAY60184.1 hypothetical protein ET475_09410 [Microbacterium protaetiae]
MNKHSTTVAVATSLALLGALTLTGCGAHDGSGFSGRLVFEDKHEAAAVSSPDVPAWVPDDATNIVIDFPGSGSGYLMKFASHEGVTTSKPCVAIAGDPALKPTISTDWWPKKALNDDRLQCDTAQLASDGSEWYVWQTE